MMTRPTKVEERPGCSHDRCMRGARYRISIAYAPEYAYACSEDVEAVLDRMTTLAPSGSVTVDRLR